MSRLTIHSVDTAPEAARERVEAAQQANGFLPNLIGVLANAPAALETYQVVGAINGKTSLSPAEREVVQITAATLNDCGFCVAGHTKLSLQKLRMPEELVEALRKVDTIADAKLDALARFSVAVIQKKGQVSDEELAAFRNAGYNDQQALEVVLGVSLATLCNFANSLAQTPINPELQPFANPELTAFA